MSIDEEMQAELEAFVRLPKEQQRSRAASLSVDPRMTVDLLLEHKWFLGPHVHLRADWPAIFLSEHYADFSPVVELHEVEDLAGSLVGLSKDQWSDVLLALSTWLPDRDRETVRGWSAMRTGPGTWRGASSTFHLGEVFLIFKNNRNTSVVLQSLRSLLQSLRSIEPSTQLRAAHLVRLSQAIGATTRFDFLVG